MISLFALENVSRETLLMKSKELNSIVRKKYGVIRYDREWVMYNYR